MAAPAPAAPFCSRCGTQGRWYAHANAFGCDRCQMIPMQIGAAPQMAPMMPAYGSNPAGPGFGTPACPQCRMPATFYPQTNAWGCGSCRIPVAPPMMKVTSGSEAKDDSAAMAIKIIVCVVVVIALTVLRVALGG